MKIAYAISILLAVASSSSLHAQDEFTEKPVFLTPIATSMEEAVKLQIIESLTLPESYETNLFSLGQTILLRTGREVQATRTVGRNLTLNPSIQLPEETIRLLIREACLRVPYSGWRENADLLSDCVSEIWLKFAASGSENYPSVTWSIPTEYYEFRVAIRYYQKYGEPPTLSLYNTTNGYQKIHDETMAELESQLGMFVPKNAGPKEFHDVQRDAWFRTKIANQRNHTSIIEKSENRWPIAVHTRLATSSQQWSTIIGERSVAAPDPDTLEKSVIKVYKRILTGDDAPLNDDMIVVPTADAEQPLLHNGLQLLALRRRVEGMDRLEIRFRFRPKADESESK
jgi:hypothetical protein